MEELLLKIRKSHKEGEIKHSDYLNLLVELEKTEVLNNINRHLGDISDSLYKINENLKQ